MDHFDFEQPLAKIQDRIAELTRLSAKKHKVAFDSEIAELRKESESLARKIYSKLTPWQTVQVARHSSRPVLRDYLEGMFSEFIELHGDRLFGDDHAIIGGFATLDTHRVMVIGHQKGKNVDEKVACNFGMANPEGYRKALRLMRLAVKYHLPVISLIDTPAAYPGKEAEERGQAEAIARNLTEMATLETPILIVVTGEGGSGGALGIGVGDVVMMLSHSIYSVIPPEGCAAILWRDGSKAAQAAEALKLTATSLVQLGVVDEVVPEPSGGAQRDPGGTVQAVKQALLKHLVELKGLPIPKLVAKRYEKYAAIGRYK